jgi:ribosomal-protein-alanine N-acetyltransferase
LIASYSVGLAHPSEAARIALLSREAIEQGLSWSWTPYRVLKSVHDAATNAIVAREASRLLGFAIMKYGDNQAHLLLLAVESARRRHGVGSALLAWLELTVRTAGIQWIRVEVRAQNGPARAFYRRHGYEHAKVLQGYYQGVDDAVVLAKRIGAP